MKYILFADSTKLAEEVISQIGEAVEKVYNLESWIANYPSDVLPDVISINGIENYYRRGGIVQ